MAYPTVSAPYGLKPINLIGGQVFAGSTRMFPIASGYNTSIFYGDIVELTTDGTIVKNNTTSGTSATAGIVGVFLGCEYSNTGGPIYGKNRFQYWQAGTTASDAVAYICDDPDAIFQAAICSTGTTLAYAGQWAVGKNVGVLQNTGSTSTGDSALAVGGAAPAAAAAIMRVVGIVPASAVSTTASGTTSGSSTTVTLAAANSNIGFSVALGLLGARLYYLQVAQHDQFAVRSASNYQRDEVVRDAVLHNLARLGETTKFIPQSVQDRHPEVPWVLLRDIRNTVAHDYFGIEPGLIWHTARVDLPALRPALQALADGHDTDSG